MFLVNKINLSTPSKCIFSNACRFILFQLILLPAALHPQIAYSQNCDHPFPDDSIYMALSSEERGYSKESELFKEFMERMIKVRAEEICKVAKCPAPKSWLTEELNTKGPIQAKFPLKVKPSLLVFSVPSKKDLERMMLEAWFPSEGVQPPFEEKSLERKRRWVFGNTGSKKLGTRLWYLGHTISFTSPLSVLTGPFIPIVTPVWVVTGGTITTISRVVERTPREITPEHAIERLYAGKKISKTHDRFGHRVPHLIFKSIQCGEPNLSHPHTAIPFTELPATHLPVDDELLDDALPGTGT